MRSIGELIKEERQRLGMNQDEFAAAGGMKRRAQTLYERDERAPDAAYLRALAAIGVDVAYIVTGEKTAASLSAEEIELLHGYRELDVRGKARVLGVIDGMAEPASTGKTQHIAFHGKVGQQIAGDITAPQTINMGNKKK